MLRLQLSVAMRYLFSRKKHNAVNVISLISVAGIAVATAAMVVVLSVFNGFRDLAEMQLSRIDPPLAVVPAKGKVIYSPDSLAAVIGMNIEGSRIIPVISEQALATSSSRQMAVRMMAVPDDFIQLAGLSDIIIDGECRIDDHWCISSVGVALGLEVRPGASIELYVPRRKGRISTADPSSSFRYDTLAVAGVYQVEQENYDLDMLIVPIGVASRLVDYDGEATALYVYPPAGVSVEDMREAIKPLLPEGTLVKDRVEQQAESFRMISVEKWITFLMMAFILVIASFNIISTMSMLIIEKDADSETLFALGATPALLRGIFALQGWLITVAGGIAGIIAGVVLCLGQQIFGFIKLNSGAAPASLAVDSYPVAVEFGDILIVSVAVMAVGLITAAIASVRR